MERDAFSSDQITNVLTKETTDYTERRPGPKLCNCRRIEGHAYFTRWNRSVL